MIAESHERRSREAEADVEGDERAGLFFGQIQSAGEEMKANEKGQLKAEEQREKDEEQLQATVILVEKNVETRETNNDGQQAHEQAAAEQHDRQRLKVADADAEHGYAA